MKVLIIGGTRFIGKEIARQIVKRGDDVTLFNRGKTDDLSSLKSIHGNVDNLLSFKDKILDEKFDIVIHCIAYTEKHGEDFVELFKDSKTQTIVLSSCDCYEAFQGLNRQKDKAEVPIRESSSLSSMKYYWSDSSAKGDRASKYDKNLMTDILMKAFSRKELNVTVFRLPMVYGPGDYQYPGRHGAIIKRILDGKEDIVLSDREQCQVYTYGYIENVAAAIVHSFNQSICNGKIYNIGEDYSRSRRKWAEEYGKISDHHFKFHILPEELIRKDSSFRNAPPQHLIIDSSRYKRDTGFVNPISFEEALEKTFKFAKNNPNILGDNIDYDKEKKLLANYYSLIDELYKDF